MYGLVLEGGGAKGAYHIGAYRALKKLNVNISGVSGTSIGAINGAMIVQGNFSEAYNLWYNISPSQIFNVDEKYLEKIMDFDFTRKNLSYFIERIKAIMNNRGLEIAPIRNLLQKYIDEEAVRNSSMDFGMVTVSVTDMEPLELFIEDIPEGKLIEYLLASANLPAFRMEKMDGKFFLDGGFFDNLPVQLLLNKNYKNIIAVRTFGMGRTRKIDNEEINIKYIKPSGDLGRVLDFNQEQARENLEMGYYDTLSLFNNYEGNKYYIKNDRKEDFFFEFLKNLDTDNILKTADKLGYEKIPARRCLFEFIIPRLAELMNIKKDKNYKNITIQFTELMAMKAGVPRYEIYSFEDLLIEISRTLSGRDISNIKNKGNIPEFIRKNELLSRTVKEELISEALFTLFSGIIDNYRE